MWKCGRGRGAAVVEAVAALRDALLRDRAVVRAGEERRLGAATA
jgi:hypothetical protein